MREVHLMNLIEIYNIIMTSFNKIQVFNSSFRGCDENNKNCENVNIEKILW